MSRRGIRVSPGCISQVQKALRRHGFPSQRALASSLGLSRTTITSFFNGKAIDYINFVEISERLGLDWSAIAYIEEEETSPPTPLLQGEGSKTPPFPRREGGSGGLGLDWRQVCQDMLLAQNQQRLTTNPFTASDGLTFELDEIYVPLGLVERKQRERRLGDISPEQGSRIYESETSDEIVQTFQNNEFFDLVLRKGKSKRLAIIGEPGAGKTTLLQKIAAWIIDNTSDVPIWISLADLQGKTIPEYLLSNWLISATRKVRVTPEMEEALGELFQGRVWLLLDGVDEMVTESGNALAQISKQLTGWVAELPRLLAAAVALCTHLSKNVKLICIDNSKFIDPDNPAGKIYAEMVKCGCPKSQDDAPKTMSELQTYWHLLESDKRIVLVFYNDPSGAKRQGFSDIFLNDLSKFNGAICVVTEQLLNKSLQCFSESQPMLVEDILGWIKAIVLEA